MKINELRSAINGLINEKLKKYTESSYIFNKVTCTLIYQDIFLSIQEVILTIPVLKNGITDVGINYICQSTYDMIQINGHFLIEDIFDRRVNLEDISTKELTLCLMFLVNTPFQSEIVKEIKHRG